MTHLNRGMDTCRKERERELFICKFKLLISRSTLRSSFPSHGIHPIHTHIAHIHPHQGPPFTVKSQAQTPMTKMSNQGAAAAAVATAKYTMDESSANDNDSLAISVMEVPYIVSLSSDDTDKDEDNDNASSSLSSVSCYAKIDVAGHVPPALHPGSGTCLPRVLFEAYWTATTTTSTARGERGGTAREQLRRPSGAASSTTSSSSEMLVYGRGTRDAILVVEALPDLHETQSAAWTTTTTANDNVSSSEQQQHTIPRVQVQQRRNNNMFHTVATMVHPFNPCLPKARMHHEPPRAQSCVSDSSCFYYPPTPTTPTTTTTPTPPMSCLRRSRFAVGAVVGVGVRHCESIASLESAVSMSSSSSVSFDPNVDIVTFDRPVEHWACEGWMDYFA
jgi:hypothetical protein